jgi:signal transduction histidine kinase
VELTILIAYGVGCLALGWRRLAAGQRGSAPAGSGPAGGWRAGPGPGGLGWAAALLVLAVSTFALSGSVRWPPLLAVGVAGLLAARAPGLARHAVPWVLLLLGLYGFWLGVEYGGGEYGAGLYAPLLVSLSSWGRFLTLPEAYLLTGAGLWLLWRMPPWRRRLSRLLPGGLPGTGHDGWAMLLLPLTAAIIELFRFELWPGSSSPGKLLALLAAAVAVLLVIWVPAVAADLAVTGLLVFGTYGVTLGLVWFTSHPADVPQDVLYGAVFAYDRLTALLMALQGAALLAAGLWLVPRTVGPRARALLGGQPYAALVSRVERLTETRTVAVDSAAAELRRIERDLHDGAQARLVALGMNLRAVERLIQTSPQAALALVAEARETSSQALADLRGLVRGIYPPVLADRGLADAVRALALDVPVHTSVDIELAGRPEPPVESACYFAVAEALTNAARHSGARGIQLRMRHSGGGRGAGMLRIEVSDDGVGGADPAGGTGLAGVEKRLATFDGVLAISSPPGGPTVIVMEVPCALSSPRISSS